MGSYQITCTNQSNWGAQGHGHITHAGLSSGTKYTVQQIREFLDNGNTFFVIGPQSGKRSAVGKFDCNCGIRTIRSYADRQWDNNLDSLPSC